MVTSVVCTMANRHRLYDHAADNDLPLGFIKQKVVPTTVTSCCVPQNEQSLDCPSCVHTTD